MTTLFIDGLAIFVINVGLKLETNDNLETMFLPIIMVFVIQILCTWCEYTTAKRNVYNIMLTLFIEGLDMFVIIVGLKLETNDNSKNISNFTWGYST